MFISESQVKKNIEEVQKFLKKTKNKSFYIPSFDIYLTEYVPLEDCPRYYVSGFTGSVGDVLIPQSGKAILFVDGRYHEQADNQVPQDLIEVYKCSYGISPFQGILKLLEQRDYGSVCMQGERTPLSAYKKISQDFKTSVLLEGELDIWLSMKKIKINQRVHFLEDNLTGQSIESKLGCLLGENEAEFISARDSVSWISNTRAYQTPFQSTPLMKLIVTNDQLEIISPLEDHLFDGAILNHSLFRFGPIDLSEASKLTDIKKIYYDPVNITVGDYLCLKEKYGEKLRNRIGPVSLHKYKNQTEIKVMENSFYSSLVWLKENASEGVSEIQFRDVVEENYKKHGAVTQSFSTISGFGPNGSIIHYSQPSDKKVLEGELALLDSGAFFEGALPTDTTRTCLPMGRPTQRQKLLYTLVLKGVLKAQSAVFPAATRGAAIDALAREELRYHGFDYPHGTGHGVGINVHEKGYSLTPFSDVTLHENLVGSIEPGVYIPGEGGIRLENICQVIQHPEHKNMLTFKPLVFIGYEPELISQNLLTAKESEVLGHYERECAKRERSFRRV